MVLPCEWRRYGERRKQSWGEPGFFVRFLYHLELGSVEGIFIACLL
jgi:hypothetical protein